jgi:predicted metal-dependent phosphoesterase TrpH
LRSLGPTGSDLSRAIAGEAALCRADLHVHTRHSGTGHLRMPRLRRGLPDPDSLHRAARARGMHLVTFTDLDTIDGCLSFLDRHPGAADFFMSEEVRAIEPRTRAVVSILVYDLTEAQHRELRALRGDVRDVASYARSTGLLASLGSVLGVLEAGGSEGIVRDLIRLFECFEIRNGAEARACNELMSRLVQETTAERGFGVTAGSNAHTAGRVGRTATVARARDRAGFLEALRRHRTWAVGMHGDVWGSFAEVLGKAPLHRSAAPLLDHAVRRARRNAGARRARRRLDVIDVEKFQQKARSFHVTGPRGEPGTR